MTAGVLKNTLAVPNAAVLRDDENRPFVYAQEDQNRFGRRDVELGEMQGGEQQIVKGLTAGDRVVGDGSLFLQFANSLQH